jgi:hypothetical protein
LCHGGEVKKSKREEVKKGRGRVVEGKESKGEQGNRGEPCFFLQGEGIFLKNSQASSRSRKKREDLVACQPMGPLI